MNEPAFERRRRGPWQFLLAPGRDAAGMDDTLTQLAYLIEKQNRPLVPPGRHRLDRLALPDGTQAPWEVVVKTYAVQSFWRDSLAWRNGSKAERAFRNALVLRNAGVGTPTPIAVADRWEHNRLRESHLLTLYIPDLTDFRTELQRIYASAPYCEPLMELLQCVANALRAMHDAGILHRDLGNQNIGLRRSAGHGAVPWEVYLMDLNRARMVPQPTEAQRGADLARIDLPSDFRRVFYAMYHGGWSPSAEFTKAEQHARKSFARHTALRPWRHPIREARLRNAEQEEARRRKTLPVPRGKDIWIWDERSAQAIPAYTSKDRRKYLPAANIRAVLRSAVRKGPAIRREFNTLLHESFQTPVPFAETIGLALDPQPATWARQLRHLAELQGSLRLPLLLRLHQHHDPEVWHWTLDQALALHHQGHRITFALLQNRRSVLDPKGWRQMLTLAFDRAHTFADAFEIGHAVNRSKWGIWDYREYADLLLPVRASQIQYPDVRVIGPACIDFELHALGGILERIPAPLPFSALSHHLYVDRRGAPENRQGPFDTVAKCAWLRAMARAYRFANDRPVLTEVNWPLQGTGAWSPVTSPYETLDPRQKDPSVSEEAYAAYMARYLLLTLASGHVSRVYWWRLVARGFGLIDDTDASAWRTRNAFHALQTLLAHLGNAVFVKKRETPENTWELEFTRPDAPPLCVHWTQTSAPEYRPQT
ncbi:MAG: lipopolysaccharide kinase InaA family protein [Verrucomicrobiota bacterium]|jgi:tRNA A-37 threonylcarbamoyl transferase component Bud32|nr:lipopolysaccharide kinase InaA family protein [Verrucomicrobiota bacterium]